MAGEGNARQLLGVDSHQDSAARGLGRCGCLCRSNGRGRRAWLITSAACAGLLVVGAVALLWRRPVRSDGSGDSDDPSGPLFAPRGSISDRAVTFAKLAGASYCTIDDITNWSCGFKCIKGVTSAHTCEGHSTKGYVAKWGDSCVVSFMGSQEYISMITDLEIYKDATPWDGCKNCLVHSGFFYEWKVMRSCVLGSLRNLGCHRRGGDERASVHATGHSLGGGVAALAMMALSDQGYQVGESWTFGMPRTGDENFATEFNRRFSDRFYRVTHHMDPVPHVPPTDLIINWHFQHVEPEVYFDGSVSGGFVTCNVDNDHNCSGKWWDVLVDAIHVGDHIRYMDFYIGTPGCNKNETPSLGGGGWNPRLGGRNESLGVGGNLRG